MKIHNPKIVKKHWNRSFEKRIERCCTC